MAKVRWLSDSGDRKSEVIFILLILCALPKSSAQDISQLMLPAEYTQTVTSVAFSPADAGRYALSGLSNNVLKLWDAATGREIKSFTGHKGSVNSVAFSPDGHHILSGSADRTLKLWEIDTGREEHSFSGHKDRVTSVAFSPDGQYVLSGSEDKTLKLWETASGHEIRSFSGHTDRVTSVAFSPDGQYAISGSGDKSLKLWEIITGLEVRSFSGHTHSVNSVAYSPDGRQIISGSYRPLKLWDVASGKAIKAFYGQTGWVSIVKFSPDGRYVLSGSGDRTLKLWDLTNGSEVQSFSGHAGSITSAAFNPDGRYILSASQDGTLKLWEVSTGKLLITRFHLEQTDWVLVTPDGRFDGSPGGIRIPYYTKEGRSIPLEGLFERFYTPDLMVQRSAFDAPDIRKGFGIPPLVRIVYPETGQTLRERAVGVVIEALDQGGGVDDIRLYHNGKWVAGVAHSDSSTKKVRAIQRVLTTSLVSGTNTFRATAFSRDRTEAQPFEVTINVYIAESNLHILAVGISTYKNREYNLNYSVPAAQAVADSLSKQRQGIFRNIRVQTIFDEQATRPGIEAALKQVEQDARPEDTFVFYYAGHGMISAGSAQNPAIASDFYLVPADVTQLYKNDAMLAEKGISLTRLGEICQQIAARNQLVILDAYQPGVEALAEDKSVIQSSVRGEAIAQMARSVGLTVMAFTNSEQFAVKFKKLENGLLAYTLLQGIEGEADSSPEDGKVTVSELGNYIQKQIPELSKSYLGEPQYPDVYMRSQNFPLTMP